jgi:hypothetical protein
MFSQAFSGELYMVNSRALSKEQLTSRVYLTVRSSSEQSMISGPHLIF